MRVKNNIEDPIVTPYDPVQDGLWDNVLYPNIRQMIRGAYYGIVTEDMIDEELFYLAQQAIAAFKFPHVSTDYKVIHANHDVDSGDLVLANEDDKDSGKAIPHGYFLNELTYSEVNIIITWMRVFWYENLLANADNVSDIYTDANIKAFSKGNSLDKNIKLMETYRANARNLETAYSRVSATRTPTIGNINSDETTN